MSYSKTLWMTLWTNKRENIKILPKWQIFLPFQIVQLTLPFQIPNNWKVVLSGGASLYEPPGLQYNFSLF